MSRTRIKVCGFTRAEDLSAAVEAGVDAVGFVFYPRSQRAVSVEQAKALRAALPPFIDVVALFVNAQADQVEQVIQHVRPSLLQFHGDETPEQCERHAYPYLRAFRVGGPGLDSSAALLESCNRYAKACGWLFDSHSAGYGGSGRKFDWSLLSAVSAHRVVLSGGLHAGNVERALEEVRPFAVDVSSGVETAPGVKSAQKIQQFVARVRAADLSVHSR